VKQQGAMGWPQILNYWGSPVGFWQSSSNFIVNDFVAWRDGKWRRQWHCRVLLFISTFPSSLPKGLRKVKSIPRPFRIKSIPHAYQLIKSIYYS
jgi:hypothetical protein